MYHVCIMCVSYAYHSATAIQSVVVLLHDMSGIEESSPAYPASWDPKDKTQTARKYNLNMEATASSPTGKKVRRGKAASGTDPKTERENARKMAEWLSKAMKVLAKARIGAAEKKRIMAAFCMSDAQDVEDGNWVFLPEHYIELTSEQASRVDYETLMAMMHESVLLLVDTLGLHEHPKFTWEWPKHLPKFKEVRLSTTAPSSSGD